MTLTRLLTLTFAFCATILVAINIEPRTQQQNIHKSEIAQPHLTGPEQFQYFHKGIRTAEGEAEPSYAPGYQLKAIAEARQQAAHSAARISSNGVLEWKERGPANVPGRTRGLAVLPTDAAKNTWLAGASGGGIWKTTNGGQTWINKSPDFPTLAVATLALCETSSNIVYAGTGEYIASAGTAINGNGIFKSTDGGETWSQLSSTANNSDFISITRIIVDPNNANLVLACSAPNTWGAFKSTIMRSVDGGTSWTKVHEVSSGGAIEQLVATPGNFNILYAAQNGVGALKSTDAGLTWSLSNSGMSVSRRVELAVSPVSTNRLFASAEGSLSGTGSDLYMSNNAGGTWTLVNVAFSGNYINFLGGQGWYDNTIACDPFNSNVVYFGGVGVFKVEVSPGTSSIQSYSAEEDGTSFMSLIDFGGNIYDGLIRTGTLANASVAVRFGVGRSQKAHRFLVPEGATSGVADGNYSYADYVDVPFEVWEIDANGNDLRQLMVSFRDQDRNGLFNLLLNNTTGSAIEQSREYIFINNVTYSETASGNMTSNGGHTFNQMYFFWPVLSGGSWNPGSLPTSSFKILLESTPVQNSTMTTVADVYGAYDGKNRFNVFGVDVHPDQHNMIMIPMSASTYKILLSNDGGMFISNTSTTPGVNSGDWTMVGKTYNTSQFYGADKRPGFDEYFGGMQDNGTWRSPAGENASASTNYLFNIGGDGFEVIWHSQDGNKMIGGSQGNGFRKSIDGGNTWTNATTGLTGTHPFISKLATHKDNPDVIFTVSSNGVFKSTNFGSSWTLTPITQNWSASTFLDVEVSRANANIIWAGSGMASGRNLHVSTDGGQSFTMANNYVSSLGSISKLASHPFEENTAYALFSFSGKPKVLRTTNLGQTWEDISGFGENSTSSNGFPNVAVYCLYVRPDNPDIIWVGSEIGIIESTDNGATWALRDDFINASVWDMKGQDDQVVIATHGRGIWTAKIEASQAIVQHPEIIAFGTTPKERYVFKMKVEENFDKIEVLDNGIVLGNITNVTPSEIIVTVSNVTPGARNIKFISYKGTAPFHSKTYSGELLDLLATQTAYSTYFSSTTDLFSTGFSLQNLSGQATSEKKSLQTNHNYSANGNYAFMIKHPLKVTATMPVLTYEDIALVEPGLEGSIFGTPDFKDYVVVEATKNGLDWIALEDGYDARKFAEWLTAYNAGTAPTQALFKQHEIDLTEKFAVGDTLLVRFRLYSNATTTGWGWAVNYVTFQQAPTDTENPLLAGSAVSLYPNPTTGAFMLEYNLEHVTPVKARIVDMLGQPLFEKDLGMKAIGVHQQPFDLGGYRQGTYLVILSTSRGNKTGRIVLR